MLYSASSFRQWMRTLWRCKRRNICHLRRRSLLPSLGGFALAFVALACSMSSGITDPAFIAPGAQPLWTVAPTSAALSAETAVPPHGSLSISPVQSSSEETTPTQVANEITAPTPVSAAPASITRYYTQAGDSLPVIAARFGVDASEIIAYDPVPEKAFISPNTILFIPNQLANTTSHQRLMPDSEVVFSPSARDFDIEAFVQEAGGYLSTYSEYLRATGNTSGAKVVQRVATENSINPRLLLALLEYQSGWVYGQPDDLKETEYPMGLISLNERGLFHQLVWAVNQLSVGYYGWREGYMTEINFSDGVTARLAPDLNAGTAALQYYYAQVYDSQGWLTALDPNNGLPALHQQMFGNPWIRAQTVEPLYPPGLAQPDLILPFFVGQMWSYTGGPHGAWEHDGARAALDFAPASVESGCVDSDAWVLASAPGLVVRSGNGVVVLDLDGDGYEQTGWALLYLHIASKGRVALGTQVDVGDMLGHPSCEGGMSTGTHVHIARKYNGEWFAADGPIPFTLSGWVAVAGSEPYQGSLVKDGRTISSSLYGSYESRIIRTKDDG